MDYIRRFGCYTIAGKSDSPIYSIHDIIHLMLKSQDMTLLKTSYSLDELRDLESKLVLITGSKSENRVDVEHFLNV